MSEFNFTPVVNQNSIFKKMPLIYVYIDSEKNMIMHLYGEMIEFCENKKANFMIDEKNKAIFMFVDDNYGQSITRITDDHFSIKCPVELRTMDIKPLPPIKKGRNNSGKYLLCNFIEYAGFKGVVIDLNQLE